VTYWLLTTEYPPFFGGGIGTYCKFTAALLAEKGHAVSVFINDAAVDTTQISKKDGIRIVRFNPSGTNASVYLGHVTNISYEFAHIVKTFIEKEGKPDIIEAQEYLGIAYYLLQYKHLLYDWCKDVPVLITMHSPSFLYMEYNHVPMYRYPNYWICEMERFCLQAADHIISPSRFMLVELAKRFELKNENVTVIPNPFSAAEFFMPVADTIDANEIVFYGKLTVQKGAFKLLGYFKDLWDGGFRRPLFLLGGQDIVYHPDGKTMGDIIRKTYKTYIEQGLLRLEDRMPPAQVADRLRSAEVVIIPSCNDNLPYVVFEMMALGKVLLVSKQGGQFEVIQEGENGFVFDHEEPSTFAAQLRHILDLTKEERHYISQNAINKVATVYGFEAVYEQKMHVFQKLIAAGLLAKSVFPFIRNKPGLPANPENNGKREALLSIVVPFYNMGTYIDETVQSLLAVDYAPKEIIIVNDGSTEQSSLEALRRYRSISGIVVLDTTNKGLAHARNYGAENGKGQFLAFLDADDKVDSTYYSKAIRVLQAYENVHFVGAWTKYFENSNAVWPTFMPEPPLILYHNQVNSSALVYKRDSFLASGKNASDMVFQGLEDYESVLAMLSQGLGGVVLPEVLFHYRVRRKSMIRGISKTKKLLLYEYISKKHNRFYATFATDLFNLLNANGPGTALDNPTLDYHLTDKLPFGGKLARAVISKVKRNRLTKTVAYKIYRLLN
jgi:glycosyltransferase involved in cell wall biosynthesis